jgi:hypothetical protein
MTGILVPVKHCQPNRLLIRRGSFQLVFGVRWDVDVIADTKLDGHASILLKYPFSINC